jgi:(E)-4-hydroxy-3-methylbut-2-enyl-diphosphate synthase
MNQTHNAQDASSDPGFVCCVILLQGTGVEPFEELMRDTHTFSRRVGALPLQQEGDDLDYRSLLHRDGTVFSAVALSELSQPEQLYRKLGAKLVVGMPFKDIATSDSIFMRQVCVGFRA